MTVLFITPRSFHRGEERIRTIAERRLGFPCTLSDRVTAFCNNGTTIGGFVTGICKVTLG